MVSLFPIHWQSQIFSATIFLQLLIKRILIFHFHINIFQIFKFVSENKSNVYFFVSPTDKTDIENVNPH